jgi:hypothetical protein
LLRLFDQILPKKGAFVPPITELEVEAIMQARGLIEDFCVRRAVHLRKFLGPHAEGPESTLSGRSPDRIGLASFR